MTSYKKACKSLTLTWNYEVIGCLMLLKFKFELCWNSITSCLVRHVLPITLSYLHQLGYFRTFLGFLETVLGKWIFENWVVFVISWHDHYIWRSWKQACLCPWIIYCDQTYTMSTKSWNTYWLSDWWQNDKDQNTFHIKMMEEFKTASLLSTVCCRPALHKWAEIYSAIFLLAKSLRGSTLETKYAKI